MSVHGPPGSLPPSTAATTRIAALFDSAVITREACPVLVDDQLFPEELACVQNAVPKRRAEFGTARVCARLALAELGFGAMPLPPQADRAPTWPAAVVGTITHTKNYCAVAVARTTVLRSLGLDAEEDRTLEPGIVKMICTPNEQRVLASREYGARDAIVYFGAKEAFYKCQYPLTRTFLDFQDVELEVDFEGGTFRATVIKSLSAGQALSDRPVGRFMRHDGLVLCGLELR